MQRKREHKNPKVGKIVRLSVVDFADHNYEADNLSEVLDRIELLRRVPFETLMPDEMLCSCGCGHTSRKAKLDYLTRVLREEREDYGVRAFACKGRGLGWFHVFGKLYLATRAEDPIYSRDEIIALLDSVRDVHGITMKTAQGKVDGIDHLVADVRGGRVFAPVLPFEEHFDQAA